MTISSSTRKAGPYTGNGVTTSFSFPFKVFKAADLEVIKTDLSGIESVLVLGTDYTASVNQNQNSNPGGSISTTVAPASGYKITITSNIAYKQELDLTNQGGFYPSTINDALDRTTIQIQQLNEQVSRAAKLPISNPADAAALSEDLVRLAASADNIDTVANDKANIDAVAGNSANINAVAGDLVNINAVAADLTNIDAVKNNATNINTVAGKTTEITTVAGSITNVNIVAADKANIDIVAADKTNIDAVAGNATNINAVAGNATNINAVNANKVNIDTVAGSNSSVTTVASNIASVNNTSTNMAAVIDAPNQAAAAAASAAAAAASVAAGMYSAVQDKSANYTVVLADAGDLIRMTTTSGPLTVTLPAISGLPDGFNVTVVKWTGDANNVTVQRSGTDLINGSTSYVLDAQYKSATFVADKESGTWFASGSGSASTNIIIDPFTGNGSQTAFTLSGDPGSKNNTLININGVFQLRSTYSWSGTTITFSSAPSNGALIEVQWSQPLAIGTPADGTVSAIKMAAGAAAGNLGFTPASTGKAIAMSIVFGG